MARTRSGQRCRRSTRCGLWRSTSSICRRRASWTDCSSQWPRRWRCRSAGGLGGAARPRHCRPRPLPLDPRQFRAARRVRGRDCRTLAGSRTRRGVAGDEPCSGCISPARTCLRWSRCRSSRTRSSCLRSVPAPNVPNSHSRTPIVPRWWKWFACSTACRWRSSSPLRARELSPSRSSSNGCAIAFASRRQARRRRAASHVARRHRLVLGSAGAVANRLPSRSVRRSTAASRWKRPRPWSSSRHGHKRHRPWI